MNNRPGVGPKFFVGMLVALAITACVVLTIMVILQSLGVW